MPIDITNNIVFDAGSSGLNSSAMADLGKTSQTDAADSILRTEYEPFIRKAVELEETDSRLVAQARQALEAGQLDTPEAAQAAAESILEYGI